MYFVHPQFKKFKLFLKKVSEAKLKQKLAKFFPEKDIVFTDLGRSAFQIAVKKLGLENSEMLMPGYICDIFKPFLEKYNIKPIYLDMNLETFHAKIDESKITSQTKSILVCHTYGLPVKMDTILGIAKKYNLKIIEDCAHVFPGRLSRASEASRGNCAFFSFSKLYPTINGGMLVCDKGIRVRLPKYRFKLKNIIKFARLFPILAKVSEIFRSRGDQRESKGDQREPKRASKLSLRVFNWYLDNQSPEKRKGLAKYFQEKLQKLGFQVSPGITYISALVPNNINRDELFNKLRKKGIFCSRIWHKPLYSNLPNTSITASHVINFPLQDWFTEKDIDKIISCI